MVSRRLPVNFALARHEEKRQLILNGSMALGERVAPGRKSSGHRCSTGRSRYEPTALARRMDGTSISSERQVFRNAPAQGAVLALHANEIAVEPSG
jgi:hypothetical protein